ncbi:MAG: hypothetical protein HY736_08990 [Verrucomicrobia bacterium]|nr:hypothetical protein [Verrucomicrobiota bacterium]
MDSLAKWHAYGWDVGTLFWAWEARRRAGTKQNKRAREILTTCLFALVLENNEKKRFHVAFPQLGDPKEPPPMDALFTDGFGETDDWDIILIPGVATEGRDEREFHQCQLVSYRNRSGSTDDIIASLEETKLWRPSNGDLRLVLHLEQSTAFDWVKLSSHLQMRRPKCPFSQVFLLAETHGDLEPRWSCRQLYPRVIPLLDLDLSTARTILANRAEEVRLISADRRGQAARTRGMTQDRFCFRAALIFFSSSTPTLFK